MTLEEAYLYVLQKELEENRVKAALTIGALAAGSLLSGNHTQTVTHKVPTIVHNKPVVQEKQPITDKKKLFDIISKKYDKADKNVIKSGIEYAHKYADPVFPQAHHLLAIIGYESSWNHKAIAKQKNPRDEPAKGLMQVKFKTNSIDPSEFNTVEGQIRSGAEIYKKLYARTKDIHQTLKAYNLGPTGAKLASNKESGKRYVAKYEDSIKNFLTD